MDNQLATVAQLNALNEALANTVTIAQFNAAFAETATYA
jgi:hypothetical protein